MFRGWEEGQSRGGREVGREGDIWCGSRRGKRGRENWDLWEGISLEKKGGGG